MMRTTRWSRYLFPRDGDEARHLRPRYDGQAPFLDVASAPATPMMDTPTISQPPLPGMAATPGMTVDTDEGEGHSALPQQALEPIPDPLIDFEVNTPPGLDVVPTPSLISTSSGQPESETIPVTPMVSEVVSHQPQAALPVQPAAVPPDQAPPLGTLTQALRNSPGQLDGHPRAYVNVEEDAKWAFLATR